MAFKTVAPNDVFRLKCAKDEQCLPRYDQLDVRGAAGRQAVHREVDGYDFWPVSEVADC